MARMRFKPSDIQSLLAAIEIDIEGPPSGWKAAEANIVATAESLADDASILAHASSFLAEIQDAIQAATPDELSQHVDVIKEVARITAVALRASQARLELLADRFD